MIVRIHKIFTSHYLFIYLKMCVVAFSVFALLGLIAIMITGEG